MDWFIQIFRSENKFIITSKLKIFNVNQNPIWTEKSSNHDAYHVSKTSFICETSASIKAAVIAGIIQFFPYKPVDARPRRPLRRNGQSKTNARGRLPKKGG